MDKIEQKYSTKIQRNKVLKDKISGITIKNILLIAKKQSRDNIHKQFAKFSPFRGYFNNSQCRNNFNNYVAFNKNIPMIGQ